MNEVINFIKENWPIITPVVIAAISEFLALHPKTKFNGVLHFLVTILKKK